MGGLTNLSPGGSLSQYSKGQVKDRENVTLHRTNGIHDQWEKKSSYLRDFLLHLCPASIIPPLLLSLDAVQFSLHLSNLGLSELLGVGCCLLSKLRILLDKCLREEKKEKKRIWLK